MIRDAPDTEKAKYMIYSESIEIITHLLKALLPPGKTIFSHFLPVISREAPVLTGYSKIIGWCTGLYIDMIKFRMLPCISAVTIDADWNISLHDDAIIVCIICSLL